MSSPYGGTTVTSSFVRSYVITGGRSLPPGDELALHTLVTLAPGRQRPSRPAPEVHAIWELCSGGYLSVAEIAGHLALPVGVVRLLLTDLSGQGHLLRRAEPPRAVPAERDLLEKVLDGLRALV